MPTPLAPFPNPLLALRTLLDPDIAEAGTKSPDAPWNGSPAFLRLRLYGGSDDFFNDVSRVDIDALTDDELASLDLAETVRQLLISHPHRINLGSLGYVVLDQVTTDVRPHIVPWGVSTSVWNATAAYRITTRRSN